MEIFDCIFFLAIIKTEMSPIFRTTLTRCTDIIFQLLTIFSPLQGMTELQHTVTQLLMDSTLFPHVTEDISQAIIYLHCEILQLRENNTMLLSWDQYVGLASDAGITDDAVMKATAVLECKVRLTPELPSSNSRSGVSIKTEVAGRLK